MITATPQVSRLSASEPTIKPRQPEASPEAIDAGMSELGDSIVNFHGAFLRTCSGAGGRSGCSHDDKVAVTLTRELWDNKMELPDGTKVTWDFSRNVEGRVKIVSGQTELYYRHLGTGNATYLYINGEQNFVYVKNPHDGQSCALNRLADKSANEFGTPTALKSATEVLEKVGRWINQRADAERETETIKAFDRAFSELRMPKP